MCWLHRTRLTVSLLDQFDRPDPAQPVENGHQLLTVLRDRAAGVIPVSVTDLGNLRVYHVSYGELDSSDYETDAASSQAIQTIRSKIQFGIQPRTLNPRGDTALQNSLAGDLFQIRIQFDEKTDSDSDNDIIGTDVQLKVTYRP